MKKIIIAASLVALTAFLFTIQYGCTKSSSNPTVDSVAPSDANKLQSALIITGGTLKTGTFPTTSTTNAPVLSGYQSSAAINPNHVLALPFNFTSTNGCAKIYGMVTGATNGYFEITGSSSSNTGTIIIYISIASKIKYGTFTFIYVIVDNSGNVSNVLSTQIVINAPMTCTNATASGSEGLTFSTVDMTGKSSGNMSLTYDTYSVPDRVDVYQGTKWLAGTGTDPGTTIPPQCDCSSPLPGFVGQTGTLNFPYDASKVKEITVVVSGCLGGGTAWNWTMTCP